MGGNEGGKCFGKMAIGVLEWRDAVLIDFLLIDNWGN